MLAAIGGGAAGAVLGGVLPGRLNALSGNWTSGYIPDGNAGLSAAFPLSAVRLLDSPMRANQARNTSYLLFVDPDRMLHTFRLNYGLPSSARPCGGWEAPGSLVRGHCTGHLMSGLALTYANTGNQAAAEKGAYLVRRSWPGSRPGTVRPGSTTATCPRSRRPSSTGWRQACRSGRPTT